MIAMRPMLIAPTAHVLRQFLYHSQAPDDMKVVKFNCQTMATSVGCYCHARLGHDANTMMHVLECGCKEWLLNTHTDPTKQV